MYGAPDYRDDYEEGFNYMATKSKVIKHGKKRMGTRSGLHTNRWVNNKKGKLRTSHNLSRPKHSTQNDLSMFMDVIMTQLSKDDMHAQVTIR